MQFSHLNDGSSKAGKFAVIAGLHVLVGILFVHSLHSRSISLPRMPDTIGVKIEPERKVPPPPPEPQQPHSELPPPRVFVPQVEVDVLAPPVQPTVQASTAPDPAPMRPAVADPSPVPAPTPVSIPANTARMRTAVFADAKACALPEYPARALRNGETGTTQLALLVGADGHVTSARVERSSGSQDLDRAAIKALSLCRFQPATANGVPEAGWAQLSYVWTLD